MLQHPELLLDLDLNDQRVNLVEEGFDLAVRIGELPDSALVARPLAPIHFKLCASPDYLQRHGTPLTPADLSSHAGLVYGNVSEAQQWRLLDTQGRIHSVKLPARIRANNGDILLQAALAGLGVLAIPTFISYQSLARGELVALLPDYHVPSTTAYAVYSSRRHLPLRVRALIEFLAQRFAGTPYWDRA